MRNYFGDLGFIDVETPILGRSTPEGARDYLVPSRVHHGSFYALPQSPQLYKQILMMAGYDRYVQVARCFRDEDLRADRQPEFTQLDVEMSFIDAEDIIGVIDGLMARLAKQELGIDLKLPLPRMTYDEAMERFGHDAPDLRYGLELVDCTELAAKSDFRVFASVAQSGGKVRAINVKKGGEFYSRRGIDALTEFAGQHGAKGLAWFKVEADGTLASTIAKNFKPELLKEIGTKLQAEPGDLLLFVADQWKVTCKALYALRCKIAAEMKLYDPKAMNFSWVVEFPMFDYDDEEKRWVAMHHPFTSPRDQDFAILESDPAKCRAKAYDLVVNGYEAGGGTIRIHDAGIQQKVFNLLGIDEESANGAVRLLAQGARLRRTAARRHRAGHRPLRDALRRLGQHPRLHRLPQDAEGHRPDDRGAQRRRDKAAQRAGDQARPVVPRPSSTALTPRPESATITGFTGESMNKANLLDPRGGRLSRRPWAAASPRPTSPKSSTSSSPTSPPAKPLRRSLRRRLRHRPMSRSPADRSPLRAKNHQSSKPPLPKRLIPKPPGRPPSRPCYLSSEHAALCRVKVGDTLPEIELPKVLGGTAKLSALYGKAATVVVFWKGDRQMALDELADLGPDVVQKFGSRGVEVVGVAVERTGGRRPLGRPENGRQLSAPARCRRQSIRQSWLGKAALDVRARRERQDRLFRSRIFLGHAARVAASPASHRSLGGAHCQDSDSPKEPLEKTKVAILGMGTVGSGVAQLLVDHGDRIARHAGRMLWLEKAVVQDLKKKRALRSARRRAHRQGRRGDQRPGDQGGRPSGRRHRAGADDHAQAAGERQGRRHREQGAAGRARAGAVRPRPRAGSLDRVRGVGRRRHPDHRQHQPVPLGQPDRVARRHPQRHQQFHPHARCTATARPYADAVAEAQRLGYAEADPTLDVDGSDAAQKLAILAHLAFGARVHWAEIPRVGIDTVDVIDIKMAQEMGYRIKLLAVAQFVGDGLQLVRLADAGPQRAAARRCDRRVQRDPRRGRCRGAAVLSRPGRRADADRLRRGRRPDRHRRRPHGDHVPHARALVEAQGPRRPARLCEGRRPVLPPRRR